MRRGEWGRVDPGELWRWSRHGIVRVADLRAEGMSGSAIDRRCAPGGPWQRILPGLILLHNGVPTGRQRRAAAVSYGRSGAMLTGRSAMSEHGYEATESSVVHLLIPHTRRIASRSFVTVERTTALPTPVHREGLACAPLVRAVTDAARRCSSIRAATDLLASVVQRGDVDPAQLLVELDHGSRRGTAIPRRALDAVRADVHSVAEAEARALWRESGLPEMIFNPDIVDGRGAFVARPDGWFDDVALAWEIDSVGWHLSPGDYACTMQRRARMQRHGIIVLATQPARLRSSPAEIIADLRASYELARSRPRPDISVAPG
ncbi:hypothetical protein G4H71_19040 [Rhodococcus triatomae]|uniref:DUF559 domain-containing protein n=1 Tax=Rhodococcus triatomae TaxID=300028 RepID=A0A1G8Q0L0_9NOCA|nr:hypothetical protein [Rhodococcus triatomae]QNG19225.1 hypothetical protein G4H72_11335 [Rhodococcus triatomae]QNG24862.1 hypothetical protein G4H71_19040 [Rhodococcus triatomae]SDI97640.1 hypothetical protein SAMN05444695_11421 [Rhodococcus triatomae]